MKNLFLAKSNPIETIIGHTENLLKEYETIKHIYPDIKNINWSLLYLACLYHDLGKINTKFQNKIIKNINKYSDKKIEELKDDLPDIEEIPHGYLSSAFIPEDYLKENFTDDEIRILYESIYYHHNREKLEGKRREDLLTVIKEDLIKYKDDFKYDKLLPNRKLNTKFRKVIKKRVLGDEDADENVKAELIMTKGLLNKIDFAASSNVKAEIASDKLEEHTEKSISKFGLNKLQIFMKNNSDKSLIVKASTGIGKTEGALIWIGNNKGFFTLPLRVSINSIYDRIIDNKKINYPKEKVGLLHSDTASEYLKRDPEGEINKNFLDTTKQLSLPLTICTVDQLIGFIFRYEGFELKLATLSYSKLVIDEIQMYSSDMVAYLILALRDIVKMGGKFAIVTATFPPIFEKLMNFVGIEEGIHYIKPKEAFLKEVYGRPLLRHKMKVYKCNISVNHILNECKGKKVLVIVNTVKKAQELYKNIKKMNKYNVFTFHSKFIKEDRAAKEKQIFKDGQLNNKFEGIWITTQVVEASLDIDFDILYTELSDISGLMQRMGRVFRNRRLENDEVNINVFVGDKIKPSGIYENSSIIDIDAFNKSKEAILKYNNYNIDEKTKMELVEEVYSYENMKDSKYFTSIKDTILAFNDIEPYNLKKNEQRLRDITSETVIPKSVYRQNKEKIEELINLLNESNKLEDRIKIKDEIMKMTLSVPSREIDFIRGKGGLIEELQINNYEVIKVIPCKYSFDIGLERSENLNDFDESQFI